MDNDTMMHTIKANSSASEASGEMSGISTFYNTVYTFIPVK